MNNATTQTQKPLLLADLIKLPFGYELFVEYPASTSHTGVEKDKDGTVYLGVGRLQMIVSK